MDINTDSSRQAGQSGKLMRSCLVILDSASQIMTPSRESFLVVQREEWSNHYLQVYGAFAASLAGSKFLSGPQQTYSFGLASLASLPNIYDPKDAMVTYLSEGLHFRGGSRRLKNSPNIEIH